MSNTGHIPRPHDGLLLCGIDGTNPLGFFSAIGTFRLLSLKNGANIKMAWSISDGTWRPILFGVQVPIAELGNELHSALTKLDKSVWLLDRKLPFSAARLRQESRGAVDSASGKHRDRLDSIASLGIECYEDDKGNFRDTALRMVRSGDASGQGLLAYGKRILESTTAKELLSAITEVWQYQDRQCDFTMGSY